MRALGRGYDAHEALKQKKGERSGLSPNQEEPGTALGAAPEEAAAELPRASHPRMQRWLVRLCLGRRRFDRGALARRKGRGCIPLLVTAAALCVFGCAFLFLRALCLVPCALPARPNSDLLVLGVYGSGPGHYALFPTPH